MTRLRLAALLALAVPAGAALADPAADCRDREARSDAERLPLCDAAIAAATDPRERADLLLYRSAILSRAGNFDAALAASEAAAALVPDWADPWIERAWTFRDMGDAEAAVEAAARARAVEPGSAAAFQESLGFLADAGRFAECLALAPEAVRLAPDDPRTYANRGRCLHEGDPAAALADYRRAIATGLDEAWVRANAASALIDLGRPADAVAEARAAVALDPADAWAQRMLVASLLATGDPDAALAAWEAARPTLGEDREGVANAVAWGLYEAGRPAEGLAAIEGWIAGRGGFRPGEADAIDTYAHLLAATGRAEAALKAFLKAVAAEGPARRAAYEARLDRLGLDATGRGLEAALRDCLAGGACRLSD